MDINIQINSQKPEKFKQFLIFTVLISAGQSYLIQIPTINFTKIALFGIRKWWNNENTVEYSIILAMAKKLNSFIKINRF